MDIRAGQAWQSDSNEVVFVIARSESGLYWEVGTSRSGEGTFWTVDASGRGLQPGNSLAALLEEAPATTEPTKLSNPKEAMGDKKVPLWLCSTIAMAHWAAAQVAGYVKYGAWNWRAAGVRASTYIAAIQRHLGRWTNGERLDPVDGTHHLGNIMACCAILLEAEALGKLNDDRPPKADAALAKALEEVEQICARLKVQYADKAPKHWTIADDTTEGTV